VRIWLVNPFDPLPKDREQPARYGELARRLRAGGHEVTWWSSSFSHRFKEQLDRERVASGAKEWGIRVELLLAPAYRSSVSFRRLWNHRLLGRALRRRAEHESPPDLILASSPPLELAAEAARLGKAWGIPTVVDIQDQWPDNFVRVMPRILRPFARVILRPYYALERTAYRQAMGLIGVAQGYVNRGTEVGGAKRHAGVFPLGVSVREVDEAIAKGEAEHADRWRRPAEQTWLLYSGSLSHNYDVLTIVRAAALAKRRFGSQVQFVITGTGELTGAVRQLVRDQNLDNVRMVGFLDFPEWAYLMSQTDAGFNASFPDALIYLPTKLFYYLAAGAAILNTIPGECADLIERSGCGLNYTAGDVQSCFDAVCRVVQSPDDRARMGTAARRLADEVYDRRIINEGLTRFLEGVAADSDRTA